MATTNLISKSLGDVLTESGNGTPDHTSPLGSLYSDKDTGNVWRNVNGGTSWELLSTVAYGNVTISNNTTTATSTTLNTWVSSAVNVVQGIVVGFSGGTGTRFLTLLNGYDGDYEVKLDSTLERIAGSPNYEVGISVDNTIPEAGRYNGCYVDATHTSQHVGVMTTISLVGGNTLSVGIRNLTDSSSVYLKHLQLFARKVG